MQVRGVTFFVCAVSISAMLLVAGPCAGQEALNDDLLTQASDLIPTDPASALALAQEQLSQAEAVDDGLAASRAEEVIAQAHVALRDFGRAGLAYERAINRAEEADAPARALAILSNLSKLHFRIGEYNGAMDAEQQSLEIARRSDLPVQEAQSLNNIGVLHKRQGNAEKALEFYMKSLEIRRRINDERGVAQSLNNIGILHKNWGNYYQSLDYHLRALELRRGGDSPQETAQSLSNIGIIYRNLADYDKALEYFDESKTVLGEQPSKEELVSAELNSGHTLLLMGEYPRAQEHLEAALNMARELSLRPKIAEALALMGELSLRQDDPKTAISRLQQALRLAEEVGEPAQAASVLSLMAQAQLALNDPEAALENSLNALSLAEALSEPAIIRDVYDIHSRVLANKGQYQEAFDFRLAHEDRALKLLSAVNSRRMADLEASLELQRSEAELRALQLENKLQNEVVSRQRLIGIGLIVSVIATLLVIALLISRFRLARAVNATLSQQSARSQRQHDELSLAHSELERRAEELTIAATTDPLTGLHNRYFVIRELESRIQEVRRGHGVLSVIMLDFDHFKRLNDTHTHMGGDRVLRDGAKLMRETFGPNAVIGRFGGEEFLVMLDGANQQQALERAENLRRAIESHRFRLRGKSMQVTISAGVADFRGDASLDIDGLLHEADHALYEAKRGGRNRVVGANPSTGGAAKSASPTDL